MAYTPRLEKLTKVGHVQTYKVLAINEQILYELIFQSNKQRAIKFRAWVTGKVLPSIREYGEYRTNSKIIRKSLTDTIKDEIPESPNKRFKYKHFTELAYKKVFNKDSKELKKQYGIDIRSNLIKKDLKILMAVESIISGYLELGKSYDQIKEILDINN